VEEVLDLKDMYVGNRKTKEAPRCRCHNEANDAKVTQHTDLHSFDKNPARRPLLLRESTILQKTGLNSRF
jgi:hypothetical protein